MSRSYQYDLNGNRTRRVEGAVTTDFTYDRADQLATQVIAGVTKTFDYDRYGNLTSGWDSANAQTTYAYDEANRRNGGRRRVHSSDQALCRSGAEEILG